MVAVVAGLEKLKLVVDAVWAPPPAAVPKLKLTLGADVAGVLDVNENPEPEKKKNKQLSSCYTPSFFLYNTIINSFTTER